MKSALSISAASLLVFCSVLPTRAQQSPPPTPASAPVADPAVPRPTIPSFKGTLVVLEGDWSKAATAKQIEQDLQTALKDVPVPDNLRQNLAASGPQILFASEQAYLYRPEDLNDLLVWLDQHKLIRTRIHCAIPVAALGDEPAISVGLDVLPIEIGFPPPPPFVHQRFQWHWSFSFMSPGSLLPDPSDTRLIVHRRLVWFREYVSQQERSERRGDLSDTAFESSFPRNRVAVVHAFADPQAAVWRKSTSGRGVEAILVVREASLSVPALENGVEGSGAVRIAEQIRPISRSYSGRRSRTPRTQPPGGPPATAAQILAEPPTETLKIFSLQHLDPETAGRIVSQLYDRDSIVVGVDLRLNSLIARGDPTKLAEVEALLLRLDSEPSGRTAPGTSLAEKQHADLLRAKGYMSGRTAPGTSLAEPKRPTDEKSHVAQPADAESHAANYFELEKLAAQTAAKCQHFRTKQMDSHPEAKELRDRLRQQVSAAFDARQRWQDAELAQLRARLAAIEQSLAARQRIKDTIIDRRVEELLEPALQWEPRQLDPTGGKEAQHVDVPAVKAGDVVNVAPGVAPPANQDWAEVERILYTDLSGKECGIDLDTGKLYALPREYNRVVYPRDEIVRWASDREIDLFYPAKPGFGQLTCVRLGLRALDNTTWEKVTREDMRDFMKRSGTAITTAETETISPLWADHTTGAAPSHVYEFVTSEGTWGIVQIVGTAGPDEKGGSPSGVKIRYRIIERLNLPGKPSTSVYFGAGDTGCINPPSSMDGPDGAICRFVDAACRGDGRETVAMLTALARKQVEACAFHVRPQRNDTARFELGSVEFVGSESARVASKWTDLDDSGREQIVPQVWLLRKEPEGWRIAGMEATVFGVQPPLHFDFENIQPALQKLEELRKSLKLDRAAPLDPVQSLLPGNRAEKAGAAGGGPRVVYGEVVEEKALPDGSRVQVPRTVASPAPVEPAQRAQPEVDR